MRRQQESIAAIAFALAGFFSPPEARAEATCPSPTEAEGGECVLTHDATLTRTLMLPSSTTLNCQGHTLTADTPGSGSTVDTYEASVPELAILLDGTTGATVTNCTLEGFDFGVVVIQSKIPEALQDNPTALALRRNKILSNTITARAVGVLLYGADNTEISTNTIRFTLGGGKGIFLGRDSDKNWVNGNIVSGSEGPGIFARVVPGNSDYVFGHAGGAVVSASPPGLAIVNLIIDGTLWQFPNVVRTMNSGNVIDGNIISHPANHGIILAGGAENVVIRNNTVMGGRFGIATAGYSDHFPGVYPTTCTLDPARFCGTDNDCFISGVDAVSKGNCNGTRTVVVDVRMLNVTVEANTLYGPFNEGALEHQAQIDLIVQDNQIYGAGNENGIRIGDDASQTATVRRNVISGTRVGLVFTGYRAHPYGAKISLNDFRGNTKAIEALGSADLGPDWGGAPGAVELSAGQCAQDSSISCSSDQPCVDRGRGLCANMRGNYWGRTCGDSEGFREFHETAADSPKGSIVDSHPYGVSVAEAGIDEESLPATCK